MGKKKPRLWPEPAPALAAPAVDNHTHLPLKEGDYVQDSAGTRLGIEQQMALARAAGVTQVVASLCEYPEVAALAATPKRWHSPDLALLRWAVAIHPNEAANHAGVFETAPDGVSQRQKDHHRISLEQALALVEKTARENPDLVVAIGETGLDYFRTSPAGQEAQKQAFRAHIALAKDLGLPLQIHDRQAHDDCIEILLRDGAPEKTVFHCFSGDAQMAQILNENGWYASFAGNVTYPANTDLQNGARALDRALLLVETDAPYLTPVPWRGHPNATYVITHTVRYLSQLLEISETDICNQISSNSRSVYGAWGS